MLNFTAILNWKHCFSKSKRSIAKDVTDIKCQTLDDDAYADDVSDHPEDLELEALTLYHLLLVGTVIAKHSMPDSVKHMDGQKMYKKARADKRMILKIYAKKF